MKLSVEFVSHHRKAQCAPNPDYPNGIDLDVSRGKPGCSTDLPYPAPECGLWVVKCSVCGMSAGVTAAGRIDDPKSVKIPCRIPEGVSS